VDAPPPEGDLLFAADVRVLLEQKRALRDEMRVRDGTIRRLKVQLKTLQDALEKAKDQIPDLKALKESAAFKGPMEMPDDRVF
jgi:phage shock protein A